jgi:hypothetical protein
MESTASSLAKGLLVLPRWWLRLACVAWAASGCLIPQDDTLLVELPQRRNRPPRILENLVNPPERITQDFGTVGRCELEFSVAVEDPDVDDLITVSWYLDYSAENRTGYYRQVALANNGEPQRGDRATLRINLGAANSPLSEPGVHLVEALVSDARLVGRDPEQRRVPLADGGVIINPGYAVTYAWFVNTVSRDCQ